MESDRLNGSCGDIALRTWQEGSTARDAYSQEKSRLSSRSWKEGGNVY